MKINQAGIDLIKEFEGFRADAYYCPAGVLTIGYGHTQGVYKGMHITKEQGEVFLKKDLEIYEKNVNKWGLQYQWNENEFSALVSFAFNCGSIDQLVQNGKRKKADIAAKMLLYVKDINGKKLAGLERRRKAEKALYETPVINPIEKEYKTVNDIVRGIWDGDFGTPWSKSDLLYKYFLNLVNKGRPKDD